MPDHALSDQSPTGTRPGQSAESAAQPLPADVRPWRQQALGRLRAAINQIRGMARRTRRRA